MAVVAVLVVLAVLGGALATRSGGDSGEGDVGAGDGGAAPDDPGPATTSATGGDSENEGEAGDDGEAEPGGSGGPGEDEVREVVDEVSAFVEEERGLRFLQPVEVTLLPDDQFQARVLEDFDEQVDDLEVTGVVLSALGLVSPELDIVEAMRSLTGAGVVGFYDTETGELVVRGADLTPYVRSVIAHELVHALDDQHFELDRPAYDETRDETVFGFLSLVEGNARRIEDAYVASMSEADQQESWSEQLGLASEIDVTNIPMVLMAQMTAPYELGQRFVDAVVEEGGQERLDAAFAEPPTTSEQVLEPEAYLAGEGAVEVPVPRPPGEVLDDGALGQYMVTEVLSGELSGDEAREVAAGWGGDWAVAWRDGDRPCVTIAVVGDTPADTEALLDAFTGWAQDQPDASVEPGTPEGPFTAEACADLAA